MCKIYLEVLGSFAHCLIMSPFSVCSDGQVSETYDHWNLNCFVFFFVFFWGVQAPSVILAYSLSLTGGFWLRWVTSVSKKRSAPNLLWTCPVEEITPLGVLELCHVSFGDLMSTPCWLFQKPDNSADVSVGTLIALVVDEGDDWQNVQVPASAEAAPKSSAPASPPPAVAPPPPPAAPAAAAAAGTTCKIFNVVS